MLGRCTATRLTTCPTATVLPRDLPELDALERLLAQHAQHLHVQQVCHVALPQAPAFPVYAIGLGSTDPGAPAAGFFGGVHGLERIGAQVVIAFLQSVLHRLPWDSTLQHLLERVRLVFMPIVNPGGMWAATRANPRGIDLMRNAPVDARDRVPFLVGGQRLSSSLPWYRGRLGDPMEAESQALCSVVQTELLGRPFSLALDCHSGFGVTDRLWFPYAHTREPMAHLAEVHALQHIFLQAHSQHPYVIEPQSAQYLAHGDLWDHLYLQACQQSGTVFLPLTLEMGSWLWIKKNPQQLFSRNGIFNPLITHRHQRVLRRHLGLLDFLTRAAASHSQWLPLGEARQHHHRHALDAWY